VGRLKDARAREEIGRLRESIEHKIHIVRLIGFDTTPARLERALQFHPSTRDLRKYTADDPARLAHRLEIDAQNELHLLLAYVYRLGYHKLLIFPFRPSSPAHKRPPGTLTGPGAAAD
jgi:hypothetical protein